MEALRDEKLRQAIGKKRYLCHAFLLCGLFFAEQLANSHLMTGRNQMKLSSAKKLRYSLSARLSEIYGSLLVIAVFGLAATLPTPTEAQQVLDNVDLDGNGRHTLVVRSATATPEMRVGRYANNAFTFTVAPNPGANFRLLGANKTDAGAKSDLLFQNIVQGEFGETSTWLDFDSSKSRLLRNVKRTWDVQAVGDLDGDGFGDLVWRYVVSESPDTGVSYIWFTQGAPFTDATIQNPKNVVQVRKRGGAPLSWTLLGAADINGDGAADMVYISPAGAIRILMATPSRTCANISGGTAPFAFTPLKFANFSGDARGDILYRNSITGAVQLAKLSAAGLSLPPYTGAPDDQNASCTSSALAATSTVVTLPTTDPSWQLYGVGDFDGNGVTDIVWLRPNGQLTLWLMSAAGAAPSEIANAGIAPFTASASLAGTLIDAPVAGVAYSTSSGVVGVTDANGTYRYNPSDTITFTLGTLTLATISATAQISPFEMAGGNANKLTNLLVLLQSLDADGNPANGINITAPTAAGVSAAINLNQEPAVFASTANTALLSAITAGGLTGGIRSITQANGHFASQASAILSANVWFITNGSNDSAFVRFTPSGEYLIGQAASDHHVSYGTTTITSFDAQTFNIQFNQIVRSGLGRIGGTRFRSDGGALINPQGERMEKVENIPGSIVGAWALSLSTARTVTIIFTSAGKYMLTDPVGDSTCARGPPGVEFGNYSYNATTKLLAASNALFDTNGCAGLRDDETGVYSRLTFTLNADGITATAIDQLSPSDTYTFYRISK